LSVSDTVQLVVGGRGVGVVVAVWVDCGAGRTSMISTSRWDGWLSGNRFILFAGIGSTSSSTSVASLVRSTDGISVLDMVCSKAISSDSSSSNSSELSVLVVRGLGGLWAPSALEPRSTRAGSVVVGWGWAETLLALVVTCEPDLGKCAEEEEEGSNESDSKADLVQATSKAVAS